MKLRVERAKPIGQRDRHCADGKAEDTCQRTCDSRETGRNACGYAVLEAVDHLCGSSALSAKAAGSRINSFVALAAFGDTPDGRHLTRGGEARDIARCDGSIVDRDTRLRDPGLGG